MRHPAPLREGRGAPGGDVSGRMLLLRGLRDGMPEAGGNPAGASADEPGEVCAGEVRIRP